MEPFRVVICGAGIAGVEGLLRLRRLAGKHPDRRLDLVLLSPHLQLDYRPLAVAEPFGDQQLRRFPLDRITADAGAQWVRESLGWVDRHEQLVFTASGRSLPYDALLLAPGGRQAPTNPFMDAFNSRHGAGMYHQILESIEDGRLTDLAFVVPDGPSWPLPLYELAFLTAQRARERGKSVNLSLVTPAPAPLAVFGSEVSERVATLLHVAGVRLYCGASATMTGPGHLLVGGTAVELHPQRTVTLQRLTGPDVPGIPGDARHRFLEIDQHCRVRNAGGRIFAAGDATLCAVKHGGLSAQQADTAAAGIAHLAGCGPPSKPLYPVLRCALRTGTGHLYLTADLIAGQGWNARVDNEPPWDPQHKIVAEELSSYLDGLAAAEQAGAAPPPPG
ncbi:MAG TPA: FAD/NAD(P)-binding oxidoreductase [Frankiaceae bacterium]|nr:FAD/NAD(P)-binding oxidoreductase [Frankiaceae bacterium]